MEQLLLPDDVLANILGRLPPRSLAAAWCVCADWRAVIDDRRLLRTDLLPLSELNPIVQELEWPPSRLITRVFSSATKRWEDRPFVREGEAAGTVGHLQKLSEYGEYRAVYWPGALYVHHFSYVIRLSMSDGKYRVIKLLPAIDIRYYQNFYFGKSEKGQVHGPWILRDVNYNLYCEKIAGSWFYNADGEDISLEENTEALLEDKFEWYSDNDDVVEAQGGGENAMKIMRFQDSILIKRSSF
uniref:F-box domain-containing protein n=1 Tax=Oryza rufipogon TaxID=4529 RepID=A0A0E0NZ67_ORYRU